MVALAAMAENRVIGRDGKLPWHLKGDLQFFKKTTMGAAVLFGRKTFEGLGRTLPGRVNLVLSRSFPAGEGYQVVRSAREVGELKHPVIFVCGGAEIYKEFFPQCATLYLTRVDGTYEGDAFLPPFEHLFEYVTTEETGEGYRIERWARRVIV
jgi:dihydrofolate reductase